MRSVLTIGSLKDHMEAVANLYHCLMDGKVKPVVPVVPFYSSVSSQILAHANDFGADYWVRNLVSPVQFFSAVSSVLNTMQEPKIFLEIGPHSALASPIRQILKSAPAENNYCSVLTRAKNSHADFLRAVGELWLGGYPVDIAAIAGHGSFLNDLPRYPWHYEESLWAESRLSREYRLREYPHHELLGSRILESTPQNPAWRNLLRLESVPWIKDHDICGDTLLPGVGFFCMAGEAVRQLTTDESFTVRHVHIRAPLVLSEDHPAEIITQLSRSEITSSIESDWYNFSIISYQSSNNWTRHAFGQVRGGAGKDRARKLPDLRPLPRALSSRKWYRQLRAVGLEYGSLFMGLREMTADPTEQKVVASITNYIPRGTEQSKYAIHPATLDCLPQGFAPATTCGLTRLFHEVALPTYVDEFYVRPPMSTDLKIMVTITEQRQASYIGHAVATCNGEIVAEALAYQMSAIGGADKAEMRESHAAVELQWKEDVNLISPARLIFPHKDQPIVRSLLEQFAISCMLGANDRLCHSAYEPTRSHLKEYRAWLTGHTNFLRSHNKALLSTLDTRPGSSQVQDLYAQLQETDAHAAATAIKRVAESCHGIFCGEVDELDLLLEDNVLHSLYDFMQNSQYSNFLDLIAHRQPNLRVLEIGAGTGGSTAAILPALVSPSGQRMYQSYTYTDVSPGFFASAKERFQNYEALEFSVLDISKDPERQGFQRNSFDLIIACNVRKSHFTNKLLQVVFLYD